MKTSPLLKDGIRDVLSGEIKPSEWAALCCDVIEAFDKELSAWSFFDRALVASSALELDKIDWSQEKPEPLLAGAPIGVKDIFNTVDHPNSMGSEARKGYWPGNDARVVTWAKLLGAQIVGKTTTAEFAVDCAPDTINPWNKNIMPGTSSTGSAVAVATGMVPAALSSQSAGSIARPASYNGVVGVKASFGLIPRTGVLKTCDTLDTIGWMTRCVEDSKIICDALRVKGKSYPVIERGIEMNAERFSNVSSYKIGILSAPGFENILPDTATKLDQLLLQLNNKKNIELIGVDLRDKLSNAHQAHAKIYDKNLAYYFQRELENIEL
jgi:Asp-tRNA(Asn)/Glu-tRNA(Gln) amidotransferase A subunit family amidase